MPNAQCPIPHQPIKMRNIRLLNTRYASVTDSHADCWFDSYFGVKPVAD
ncbi:MULTISPECIES: hypothetical protein [Calothrix]|nr:MULTISPECIES: hypothetical protein [Calothrix]